ncbi:60S ribosomal protein L22 [Babesia ovata]|uniref:Large ribosomal subunit protein eL22 n=2 Tax=Babesia TaxID=5864 RepID=A0A2H6KFL9_9APIC|nr:60S ribosomal L22e protein, putative [Babesia bigemina]XP_028868002.1 60S ribosomal protein L22 [Babesia ovata]GBE61759.1 60S ribosomal protein L22 [Babesia ovata]CDR95025.1 60S ribosomal L22e protein, putative [Babesia bigemina]|eukprot:XP_012767211.1 60S ribosomal L22e protein, putative [Babesia bigemina]
MKALKSKSQVKKAPVGQKSKFMLDCTAPANDNIINPSGLEKFLQDRIKVDGKTGNLGTSVTVTREKNKIHVTAEVPFSKRYIKYLTKKYLKKQQLRDFLRVVANKENSYELRYFQINDEAEA